MSTFIEWPVDLSIVISTRNRATFLPSALQSLTKLKSKFQFEILIVDNASTDNTADVISRADTCGGRLRQLFVGDVGLGAARDAGWRACRGQIVAFTDDDCYPDPTYVDAMVEAFRSRPEAGCIGGRILLHDPADLRVTIDEGERPRELMPCQFVPAGNLHGANLAFRRSALEAVGGFDRQIGAGTPFPFEDVDAVAAVIWAGMPAWFDPAPVVRHHHRRRGDAALHQLFVGYDRGRGAYYAKYILRRSSRLEYLRAWWSITRGYSEGWGLVRVGREIKAFFTYLHHRKAYFFMVAAAPVVALCYAATAGRIAMYDLLRRLAKRSTARKAKKKNGVLRPQ
ncbi:glycosyltransferase [Roseomonas sp. KE2513]|uniref:glycosyltransferase family 2 protein n=1 Tax=Roseomonas sp. KE2513 TaxID=2479202 RepID=UPI0018E03152|nr:glycosyltransferase family 2 protein [Roseomonas sp. KE2513]MBI0535079.1 glycosyltransferase [Roseomonas sp. KE2513]